MKPEIILTTIKKERLIQSKIRPILNLTLFIKKNSHSINILFSKYKYSINIINIVKEKNNKKKENILKIFFDKNNVIWKFHLYYHKIIFYIN